MGKPGVLVIARTFPNSQFPTLGIYTQRLTDASTAVARPTVIAAVPRTPPGMRWGTFGRFRAVEREQERDGYRIVHPRILVGPGHRFHALDARLALPGIRRAAHALAAESKFDLIHAHFIYPDGVIAAQIGKDLGAPVVVSEHSVWQQWFQRHPRVRRQVEDALAGIARLTAVSESLRADMEGIVAGRVPIDTLPNVVDDRTFFPAPRDANIERDRLLFVGTIRRVKGLDILVRALSILRKTRPAITLTVVGGAFYRAYARDERDTRALVSALGLGDRVRFLGECSAHAVADEMRRSAMLVVPSRRETFSLVTAEALACGIPVVATRCGGPEEIVTPDVGRLVAVDDVDALVAGIEAVLDERERFSPAILRESAVSRYGSAIAAQRIGTLYARVIRSPSSAPAQRAGA